ncbi:MAG: terminase small subunit [Clostridiales bacterium]|nr:terminase small subunit [Clostridiales bacterium]
MEKELTSREKLFCYHYLMLGNAKEAAIAAGFPIRNAHTQAAKLLSRGKIREFLNAQYDSLAKRKVDLIISGLERLAFGGINDAVTLAFSDEINGDRIGELDLFNVSEIKRPKSGGIEIKFFDRQRALERLLEIQSEISQNSSADSFFAALYNSAQLSSDKRGVADGDKV